MDPRAWVYQECRKRLTEQQCNAILGAPGIDPPPVDTDQGGVKWYVLVVVGIIIGKIL